jgi:hypothetical protein
MRNPKKVRKKRMRRNCMEYVGLGKEMSGACSGERK